MQRKLTLPLYCFLSALVVFLMLWNNIKKFLLYDDYYSGFYVSDFMINYQGGFIRRGLLGELLYQIFLIHPFPIHWAVLGFMGGAFILFITLCLYVFHRMKIFPIMPFSIIIVGFWEYRRDFFMIIMAFFIYKFLFEYFKKNRVSYLVLTILLSTLAILIYEPSFFFLIPISMLLYSSIKIKTKPTTSRLGFVMPFVFPITAMLTVCLASGGKEAAESIWHSWSPLFAYLNLEAPKMTAIHFLAKPIPDVMLWHLDINFNIESGLFYVVKRIFQFLLFITGMFYLTVNAPSLNTSYERKRILSNIFIVQFISLLPMFSVLSCDVGRTILYVVYSTYFLAFFIENSSYNISFHFVDKFSNKIVSYLDGLRFLRSDLCYFLVMICVPFGLYLGVQISRPLGLFIFEWLK